MSGYQEILEQNILYIVIEKNCQPIPLPWIEAMCMFKPLIWNLWAIAIWKQMGHNKRKIFQKQLQSENRCNQIKKILYKQTQSENRCIKMHIGIYTKQIGNCIDNLVLAKKVPQFMKTLSKINSKKKSHFSESKPRRLYNILQWISQTRQRRPYKISQSHVNTCQWDSDYRIDLKSQRDQKYGEKLKQTKYR
jgi:hypothetical protein